MQKNKMKYKYVVKEVHLSKARRACNDSHGNVRHSSEVVQQAKNMREQGMSYEKIAKAVGAYDKGVIFKWVKGLRRNPPAYRFIRRVRVRDTDS